jgi:hypothetical protein
MCQGRCLPLCPPPQLLNHRRKLNWQCLPKKQALCCGYFIGFHCSQYQLSLAVIKSISGPVQSCL